MLFNYSVQLEDKKLFDRYTFAYPYEVSCINFTCLYMWRKYNSLTYEIINDYLCVSGVAQGKPFILPPLTRGDYHMASLSDTLDMIMERFKEHNQPFKMKLVPKHMNDLFDKTKPNQFRFQADRDNFDYVYLTQSLIELKGRKLHSKKNHWNYFMNFVPHQYVPLTRDLVGGCKNLVKELKEGNYTNTEIALLDSEEYSIGEALDNLEYLGFKGGAILINDKVEAFTFGEPLSKDTMVVHIEKANSQIRGLYQAINQQFCLHECSEFEYVNREEDMGFEYLRKAKKSYHPVKMVEKYDVTLMKEGKNASKIIRSA